MNQRRVVKSVSIALLPLGFTLLLSLSLFSSSALAQNSSSIKNSAAISVTSNTPGFIKKATDLGPADPTTVISVTVWLKLQNQAQLDQLVQQLYSRKSPNFHKWLNQNDFNSSYSPTSQELNAVQNFLTAHGLTVIDVAENNFYVKVQGTIAQVEQAFHVTIDNYSLNGITYRSNTGDPSSSDASLGHVAAITGMDDFNYSPAYVLPVTPDGSVTGMVPLSSSPDGRFFESQCFTGVQTLTFPNNATPSTVPQATYTGSVYGAPITNTQLGHLPSCGYQPREVQTAYDMNSLYTAGFDGSGETVVIIDAYGSPTIAQDADLFSLVYGLPRINSSNFQVVKAPGLVNNPHGVARNWAIETTLDVEWAHALAPRANIALVTATDAGSLEEAVNYAVVHHLGNTISNSWSSIEIFGNPARHDRMNRILEMAAAQGIDVNFASGDFGDETIRIGIIAVDFPASSPFATGLGGTSLALNPDNTMAFQTGWGTNLTRLANPISTHSSPVIPPLLFGFQFGAGGGTSAEFAKPWFQSGLSGNARMVPDISMLADPDTGAEFIQTVPCPVVPAPCVGVIGGTSLATPLFSAVMAVAAQKAGHGLGQAAALVYGLPSNAVTDVVPVSAPTNANGTITTSSGTITVTAEQLAAPLHNTTVFYGALFNSPSSTRWDVLTFGTDSSLTTAVGWDNVTGVGTPNGLAFVNAIIQ
jgi:subtilase family serine protease